MIHTSAFIAAWGLLGGGLGVIARLGDAIVGSPAYLAACAMLFGAMLAFWRRPSSRLTPYVMIGVALLARIVFIAAFPAGDDCNRYIWEGAIQLRGFNPYVLSPDSPRLFWLRDPVWEGINHTSWTTVYGPIAQLFFAATSWISPTFLAFKTLFVLFEMATLGILLAWCTRSGLDRRHAWLFALNPALLVFTAGEAHMESMFVFAVTAALYLGYGKRRRAMFAALGCAIMIKPVALILILPLLDKQSWRALPYAAAPLIAAIPYVAGGANLLASPLRFARTLHYNGLFFTLFEQLAGVDSARFATVVLAGALYAAALLISQTPLRAARLSVALFLLFTPTFHPWYLLLFTPFLVLFRSPAWLALHASVLPLAFYFNPAAPDSFWHDTWLLFSLEWLPFTALGLYGLFFSRDRFPASFGRDTTISVVIPTFNEEDRIAACIQSIQSRNRPCEIIIADGGSSDRTIARAQANAGVRVVSGSPGRGVQIIDGLRTATGDIAVILHADSRLRPGALDKIVASLRAAPDTVGGSFAAEYDHASPRFRFTERLNNFRARILGISFGDQAQFFRRAALLPRLRPMMLMEDIEISLQCKEIGALLFLPRGVTSSTRAWKKTGYAKNFVKVMGLSFFYLLRRRIGALKADCADFYAWYYGRPAPAGITNNHSLLS